MGRFLIREKYCVNRYKNSACIKCGQACPNGAIIEGAIRDDQCNDCGICYSVCPTGAIATSVELDMILAAYQKQTALTLSCGAVKRDSQIPCLAILSGKALCALAQSAAVNVNLSKCKSCHEQIFAALQAMIAACNKNLENDRKIAIIDQEIDGAAESMDRRRFLRQMLSAGVSFMEEVQKGDAVQSCKQRSLDLFIQNAFSPEQAAANALFFSCAINDRCNGCGLCVKICPHKALRLESVGEKVRIFFDRRLCGGCGLCETQCPTNAIEVSHQRQEATVFAVRMPRCEACAEFFQPIGEETTCLSCIQRRRILK